MRRNDQGEARARAIVQRAMAERSYSIAGLARETQLDPGTIGDFIGGKRWPRAEKLARIEMALGLDAGAVNSIAGGGDDPFPAAWQPHTEPPSEERAAMAADFVRGQMHPGLRRFTDEEIINEIRTRMLLLASRLHARGEHALVYRITDDGGEALVSVPPNGE